MEKQKELELKLKVLKHREMVVSLTDMDIIRERVRAIIENKSEAILIEQTLIALAFACSVNKDKQSEDACMAVGVIVSGIHINGQDLLKTLKGK